jgi:hypothetical protein
MHLHRGDPDIMGNLFAEAAVGHLNHHLAFSGLADLRKHLGLTSTRVTSRSTTPINAFLPFSTEPLRDFG